MVSATEVTDPLRQLLRAVPPTAPGICEVCHRSTNGTYTMCLSCDRTVGQVSRPVRRVTPITMYEIPGQIWHNLRWYKDSPDPDLREQLTLNVVALLARFLAQHRDCVAPSGWDWIVGVPSTRSPGTSHPLVVAMRRVASLRAEVRELLGPGEVELRQRQAHDRGYEAVEEGPGRVLLVDDTFTSGARLQSAASALQLAGYEIVGAVVVGRVYDVDFGERGPQLWDLICGREFEFEACCWCSPPWPPLT